MNLNDLKQLKKPLLSISKKEISSEAILKELIFPEDLLLPIGIDVNLLDSDDKNEIQKHISTKLQELLDERSLNFYQFSPTPSDIIEGYGAKFLDVYHDYKGFGMYEIIVRSGFKVRNNEKDRRYLIEDKNAPSQKQEFYIFYDDVPEEENPDKKIGFRRIAKKTFFDLLTNYQSIKYQPQIRELINSYKAFFNRYFLPNRNFYQAFKIKQMESFDSYGQYYAMVQDIKSNIETMTDFYFFQNIIGELSEFSFDKILNQIETLQDILSEMEQFILTYAIDDLEQKLDENAHADIFLKLTERFDTHIRQMKTPYYYINIKTEEFHENIMSFYHKYATTENHDNKDYEALKKQLTILNILFYIYNIDRTHTTKEAFLERKKELFEQNLDDSKDINKQITERKKFLKSRILDYRIRHNYDPDILHFLYLFNDVEKDEILATIKEQEEKINEIRE